MKDSFFQNCFLLDVSLLLMDLDIDGKRLGSLKPVRQRQTSLHGSPCASGGIAARNCLPPPSPTFCSIRRSIDLTTYWSTRIVTLTVNCLKSPAIQLSGANFGLRQVMQMVRQVAPMNSPVLLMGETGVGKEVVANAVHSYSKRQTNPFIKVNCGAIPETLIDSELFGYEKGAFTGATARKTGAFRTCPQGNHFSSTRWENCRRQPRFGSSGCCSTREIKRVGGTESIPVDVRLISATNRNLDEMVQSSRFRRDLWFRINVFPIWIPPLRQRPEDIPALVSHFPLPERTEN